jgi:hypothetical protein
MMTASIDLLAVRRDRGDHVGEQTMGDVGQPTAEILLNIGFRDIAKWVRGPKPEGIDYLLDGSHADANGAMLEVRNALYAFVEGERVNYIGKTARSLQRRFVGYCNPGSTQVTNKRCNRNIRALLDSGKDTRIYVCTPLTELRYGEFQIDLAAGLEDSLILAFDPPWNGREGKRVLTEEEEREATEETGSIEGSAQGPVQNMPLPKAAPAASSGGPVKFQIKLGSTYYNQGLINPGAETSQR